METQARKIIHIDMDAFYASVEQRDRPELQGRPVVVGGKPNSRGVVAACSYEAREFGIRSAMPSHRAAVLCPEAVFVSPRFDHYRRESEQIHAVFRLFTERIEPLSLDEAYLDVSVSRLLDGSATRMAHEIKRLIRSRTRLIASAGVSYNKFLAKIASDIDKPDGFCCVLPEQGERFVSRLPIGRFHGVGTVTEARMHDLGIFTGADLRQWTLDELEPHFGKHSQFYFDAARGIDHREVQHVRTRKSLGSERTFAEDLRVEADMLEVLQSQARGVAASLDSRGLQGKTLTVKVRFSDFRHVTRSTSLPMASNDAEVFSLYLPGLLRRALQPDARVRLLGVSVSGLSEAADDQPRQMNLF